MTYCNGSFPIHEWSKGTLKFGGIKDNSVIVQHQTLHPHYDRCQALWMLWNLEDQLMNIYFNVSHYRIIHHPNQKLTNEKGSITEKLFQIALICNSGIFKKYTKILAYFPSQAIPRGSSVKGQQKHPHI